MPYIHKIRHQEGHLHKNGSLWVEVVYAFAVSLFLKTYGILGVGRSFKSLGASCKSNRYLAEAMQKFEDSVSEKLHS